MAKISNIKRYSLDKIILLIMLAFGLLIAHFISAKRSSVIFSGPITLAIVGLSISIPDGHGWRTDGKWRYENNGFVLGGFLGSSPTNPAAVIICKYVLFPSDKSPAEQFAERAEQAKAEIIDTGRLKVEKAEIDWAHFLKDDKTSDIFTSAITLPNARQFNVTIRAKVQDIGEIKKIFTRILESVELKETPLLDAGIEVVNRLRQHRFIADSDEQKTQENFFVIKDEEKRVIGFMAETFLGTNVDNTNQIKANESYFIQSRYQFQFTGLFESSNYPNEFIWASTTNTNIRPSGSSVVTLTEDMVEVTKNSESINTYPIGSAAIPDPMIYKHLAEILASGTDKFIVDLIQYDGRIIPKLVTIRESNEEGIYELRFDWLDGSEYYELVYFNETGTIVRSMQKLQTIFELHPTNLQAILSVFPFAAEQFQQMGLEINR